MEEIQSIIENKMYQSFTFICQIFKWLLYITRNKFDLKLKQLTTKLNFLTQCDHEQEVPATQQRPPHATRGTVDLSQTADKLEASSNLDGLPLYQSADLFSKQSIERDRPAKQPPLVHYDIDFAAPKRRSQIRSTDNAADQKCYTQQMMERTKGEWGFRCENNASQVRSGARPGESSLHANPNELAAKEALHHFH